MPDNPWFRRAVLVFDEQGRPVRWDIEDEQDVSWYREIDCRFFLRARPSERFVLDRDGKPFSRTSMAGSSNMRFPDKDPHAPAPPPYPCAVCAGDGYLCIPHVVLCPRCFPEGDRPSDVARARYE